MKKVFLYNHGGSENHGCEALVRSICQLLENDTKLKLLSEEPQQDYYYDIQKIAEISSAVLVEKRFHLNFIKAYFELKSTGNYFAMDIVPYKKQIKKMKKGDIEISIGGDIYCYDDYPKFIKLHELICEQGCKTLLIGCSLEKNLFFDKKFIQDMKRYDYISARESLTYTLLKNAGLKNIDYNPDTAFLLPAEEIQLPVGFEEKNTIGINISPLVIQKEIREGIVYENFIGLIRWILKNTNCAIALIPHVVWENNDDRTVLKKLKDRFKEEKRVITVSDCNCMKLKGYISKCRFFIGARTHATIAAYSTLVPTLAIGYSIKSRGIAQDLFGTDENYVISINKIQKKEDLQHAFLWIWKNEIEIKNRLAQVMPEYIEKAENIKSKIEKITG